MSKIFTLALALVAAAPLQAQVGSDLPDVSSIISSRPDGTLYKDVNHYFEGCYVYQEDGGIYDYFGDGYVSDLVEGTDGSLYIKNPFGFLSVDDAEIWVKAVKVEDGAYEVRMPQAVYDNQGGEDPVLYAWRYVKDGSDNYAKLDAESQSVRFELRGDSLVKVGDNKSFVGLGAADGFFYGYGDTVSVYSVMDGKAVVPGDASKTVEYKMSYNDAYNMPREKNVHLAFEGNRVYFGEFDDSQPGLWFSGVIDGNQLRLEKWQYMGVDRGNQVYGEGHMFLYPFGWGAYTDDEGNDKYGLYEVEEPSLAYDAVTRSFSTDELTLAVNRGRYYYPYVYYAKPTLTPVDPTAAVVGAETAVAGRVSRYDLSGRRVVRPAKGIVIRSTVDGNGRRVVAKEAVK